MQSTRRGVATKSSTQEWIDVKLQYLLQLRHSIVTCVCIHMMRDELESSESHDKVPTLLTALSGYLSHYQRLGELFEEGWYLIMTLTAL